MFSAEVISSAGLFYDAVAIRKQPEFMLRLPIPVHILSDLKSLFDMISKGSSTSEKRLILDIYMQPDNHIALEINNIGFEGIPHNLANGLTKLKFQAGLYQLLLTVHQEPKVEEMDH